MSDSFEDEPNAHTYSYFDWAAEMRDLEEQPPAVILERIANDAAMEERMLIARATTLDNGMVAAFDGHVYAGADGRKRLAGVDWTAKALLVRSDTRFLLFEDCSITGPIRSGSEPSTQQHSILALIRRGDTYDLVALRGWEAPTEDAMPRPFLRRVQDLLELHGETERAEAQRLLEIELDELSALHYTLAARSNKELCRIVEIMD